LQTNWKNVFFMFWKIDHKYYNSVLLLLLATVMITLLSGNIWLNSISVYPLAVFGILHFKGRDFANKFLKSGFAVCCLLFFLLHVLQLFMDVPEKMQIFEIEKKIGFAVIPVILLLLDPVAVRIKEKLLEICVAFLALMFAFLITAAFIRFIQTGNSSEFFYHQLVSPLHHNAVYLSAYTGILLLWLIYSLSISQQSIVKIFLIVILYCFLILLASKTIIAATTVVILFEVTRKSFISINKRKYYYSIGILLLVLTIIFFTPNPLSNRFKEIQATDMSLLKKEQYATDMYFNAVQFRLIAWKFSFQLVNEKAGYITGVGAGNAQPLLNQKYKQAKMYVGESEKEPGGYLNFNSHNQFMQTYLQTGIVGLLLLLLMLFFYFREAFIQKNRMLFYSGLIITVFFLSESVLEGQLGMLLFLFVPKLFYTSTLEDHKTS